MRMTHVKSAIAESVSLPFTFLRQSSIPPVGYRTLDVFTTAAAPTTLLLVLPENQARLAVVAFDLRHLIAKPSTRTSVRCNDLGDICCTSRGIAHFVLNFVAMATGFGRGKMPSAAFDGPSPKTVWGVMYMDHLILQNLHSKTVSDCNPKIKKFVICNPRILGSDFRIRLTDWSLFWYPR